MMGYIYVWEHSGGDRHIDVDWSPNFEDLYSLELGFMDICAINMFPFFLFFHRIFGCTHITYYAL